MQSRKQVIEKVEEMLADVNPAIIKEVNRLLSAVDLETAKEDYYIAKMLMVAAMKYVAITYMPSNPPSGRDKRLLKRLQAM